LFSPEDVPDGILLEIQELSPNWLNGSISNTEYWEKLKQLVDLVKQFDNK
jgi:hypothetical protein